MTSEFRLCSIKSRQTFCSFQVSYFLFLFYQFTEELQLYNYICNFSLFLYVSTQIAEVLIGILQISVLCSLFCFLHSLLCELGSTFIFLFSVTHIINHLHVSVEYLWSFLWYLMGKIFLITHWLKNNIFVIIVKESALQFSVLILVWSFQSPYNLHIFRIKNIIFLPAVQKWYHDQV